MLNSEAYCEILGNSLVPWLLNQPLSSLKTMIFQHDNAHKHRFQYTSNWIKEVGFKSLSLVLKECDGMVSE